MKVKFHSLIKHRLLGLYLKICSAVNKPFYYIDLYSGDGENQCMEECPDWDKTSSCDCKSFREEDPKKKRWCRWPGSPIIALKWSKTSKTPFKCIFNDLKKDCYDKIKHHETHPNVIKVYNEDANKIFSECLKEISINDPSLFFLDPFGHSDLKWSTIEGIAKHTGTLWLKDKSGFVKSVRRPELLINLMTYGMQMNIDYSPKSISIALGEKYEDWKKVVDDFASKGISSGKAFLSIYTKKLEKIYGQKAYAIEVRQMGKAIQKGHGSIIYYLIYISSHPKASKIFERSVVNEATKYKFSLGGSFYRLKGIPSLNSYLSQVELI